MYFSATLCQVLEAECFWKMELLHVYIYPHVTERCFAGNEDSSSAVTIEKRQSYFFRASTHGQGVIRY